MYHFYLMKFHYFIYFNLIPSTKKHSKNKKFLKIFKNFHKLRDLGKKRVREKSICLVRYFIQQKQVPEF